MTPVLVLTRSTVSPCPTQLQQGPKSSGPSDFAFLGANSNRPEVQALIRESIRRGMIRVRPVTGSPGRVEIVTAPPAQRAGAPGDWD